MTQESELELKAKLAALTPEQVESQAWRIEPGSFNLTAGPLAIALPCGAAAP
jgi:hypothetical protein